MEYYVLTQSGREAIPKLQKAGKHDEASILEYLDKADGATIGQVAESMNLDEKTAYVKLRSLSYNKWIWRTKTNRFAPFWLAIYLSFVRPIVFNAAQLEDETSYMLRIVGVYRDYSAVWLK